MSLVRWYKKEEVSPKCNIEKKLNCFIIFINLQANI